MYDMLQLMPLGQPSASARISSCPHPWASSQLLPASALAPTPGPVLSFCPHQLSHDAPHQLLLLQQACERHMSIKRLARMLLAFGRVACIGGLDVLNYQTSIPS